MGPIKQALVLATALVGAATNALAGTTDFVPVATLAGQDQDAVAQSLSEPDSCEPSKYGQRCYYSGGDIEIVFIGGKADWFTITPQDALFAPTSLSQLGLPTDQKPSFSNEFTIRWNGLAGLRQVELFPAGAGKVQYIYIKAKTP